MKFEIKVYEMETVNTFAFNIENTSVLDDFLYDYDRQAIDSHAYNADYDCKLENMLVGLADGMEKPYVEYPNYTYFKNQCGFYFSDFINFLADFYKDAEEIDMQVKPLESKYYGVYVDETFSDEEATEADEEKWFYYHFSNELDDMLSHTEEFRKALKDLADEKESNYCHCLFNSKALEKTFEEVKTKAYILETLENALDDLASSYKIYI